MSCLLVFLEIVLFPEGGLCLFILMSEVGFEAGTEIDVPTPETAGD